MLRFGGSTFQGLDERVGNEMRVKPQHPKTVEKRQDREQTFQ